jgi:hypothetical protein
MITDMTLEEARGDKWRPGVSWQSQMEARLKVALAEVDRLNMLMSCGTACTQEYAALEALAKEMIDTLHLPPWELELVSQMVPEEGCVKYTAYFRRRGEKS